MKILKIFFDVSGTVLGMIDGSPRPGIHELIRRLREMGHEVCFWTGWDVEKMGSLLRKAGLEGTVYSKPAMPFSPKEELPYVCVDDVYGNLLWGRTVKVESYCSSAAAFIEPIEPIEIADILKAGGL